MNWIASRLLRKFRKPIDIRQSWINEPANLRSIVEFLNWFDSTNSIDDTLAKAVSDWSDRISNFPGFQSLKKEKSLEIGFGGGRLIVPASQQFQTALGVDIHAAFEKTSEFLRSQNIVNFGLIHRDEIGRIQDGSVDFVYSFIVFQHFDSYQEVEFYLDHIQRVLAPGGYAHLFFGKLINHRGIEVTDPLDFRKRAVSLFINPNVLRDHLDQMGFTIIEYEDVMPKRIDEPLATDNESGQARILIQRR